MMTMIQVQIVIKRPMAKKDLSYLQKSDKHNRCLISNMAFNAKPQFEVYTPGGDIKDSLLQHHLVPSNIQKVKVVDHFPQSV